MSKSGIHNSVPSQQSHPTLHETHTLQLVAKLQDARVALVSERARNQAIINSLGEGLVIIDEDGKITAANPYLVNMLGFKESELIGKWYPSTIIAVDQFSNPIPYIQRSIIKALSGGIAVSENARYLRKDHSVVSVLTTVAPMKIDNKPAGAIGIFRDLTMEKQLDIAKDEFVSLASHQLKTPASGVKAILSMLSAGDFGHLTEKQQYYVAKAAASNDRQLEIVEDLLHVAKIDSGHIQLDPFHTNVCPLVLGVASEQMNQVKKRKQSLVVDAPKTVRAWVDGPKIRMVIDNLISNASKYTPDGGEINVTVRTLAAEGKALICIKDSGVGIAHQDNAKLFKKFSRIDNELSRIVGGTGLGLYLAKSIVDLHNGSISVQSKLGCGTTMTVILPREPQGVK